MILSENLHARLEDDGCALLHPQFLGGVIADSSRFYRSFRVPKRKGGFRDIRAPYPALAGLQRAIANLIDVDFIVGPAVYAYVRRRSAIGHASVHAGSKELLTIDIKDFFGSITRQMVFQALSRSDAWSESAHPLSLICTCHGVLPQGAPSSPILSNIVFSPLDARLCAIAAKVGLKYSRYADDLAFSGDFIPRNFPSYLGRILSERGFLINQRKTRLKLDGAKKIVTGVSIGTGNLKLPRSELRSLRSQIHFVERRMGSVGLQSNLDPLIYERVLGRINYFLQIEPSNEYALEKKEILSRAHQDFIGLNRGQPLLE